MAKGRAGLPDNFQLNVESPTQLGDYLDEDSDHASRIIAARKREEREQVVTPARVVTEYQEPTRPIVDQRPRVEERREDRRDDVLNLADARARNVSRGKTFERPGRVQLNMRPETVSMFDELVAHVKTYSVQDDAKASEIFEALIGVLHDARKELSYSNVLRRGKWGTPTARAFSTTLGHAFAEAILKNYQKSV